MQVYFVNLLIFIFIFILRYIRITITPSISHNNTDCHHVFVTTGMHLCKSCFIPNLYLETVNLTCTNPIMSFSRCAAVRDVEAELNMFALSRSCQVFPITHQRTEVLYLEFKQLKLY